MQIICKNLFFFAYFCKNLQSLFCKTLPEHVTVTAIAHVSKIRSVSVVFGVHATAMFANEILFIFAYRLAVSVRFAV